MADMMVIAVCTKRNGGIAYTFNVINQKKKDFWRVVANKSQTHGFKKLRILNNG